MAERTVPAFKLPSLLNFSTLKPAKGDATATRTSLHIPLAAATIATLLLGAFLAGMEMWSASAGRAALRTMLVCSAFFVVVFLLLRFALAQALRQLSHSSERLEQAERKAIDTLAYAQVLFRKSPIGIVTFRATGEVVSANPAAAAIVGASEEQLAEQNFLTLDAWKKSGLLDLAQMTLRSGIPQKRELYYVSSFGKTSWLSFQFVPFDYHGEPHLLGLFADISERKRNQEVLETTNKRLIAMFEDARDAIVLADTATGNIIAANEEAGKLLKVPKAQLIGRGLAGLHAEQPASCYWKGEDASRDARNLFIEAEIVTSDQRKVPVEISASHLTLPNGARVFQGIYRDVSQRKETEERLRKLSRAMEQSPVAIVITDPQGVVDYVNPKFTHITGYSADEVIGTAPEVLTLDPADAKQREMLASIQAGGECRGEIRNRRKNGELFWEAEAISPIRDAEGKPTHLLRIMEDITDKRRMESQLLRVQRMESMGRLATGVAHDLNNILAPILMAIDLLEGRAHTQEEENLFSMLREGAQRGAGIIQQLLVFGRGVEVRQAELQPRTLLKEIAKIVKETFPKDITLERLFPEDLWTVCADPTQVHQVLLNLCLNARDAMPRGGRLTLAAENVVLDDAAADGEARPGPYVVLQVTDTGTGIAPEIIGNIFDPFFTTKQPGQGTGLGLSTVLGIAKAHGGFVRVRSEPGRGSQFKVYLPSPGGCKSSVARAPQNALPDGQGKVVLVVDDEESILTVARRVLRKHGYRVFTAANGAEGILTFSQRRQEIQAVVTDMVMPFMDGPAFIRGLRQLSPEVRIIAMSGLPAQEAELLKAGSPPDAFLQKPFEANQIMLKLHELLGTISLS